MNFQPKLISSWLEEPSSSQPWLVPNFVPLGGLTLLSGPPKRANKTYLALIMTIGLSGARKVLGQEKVIKKPLPILFIEEEGAQHDLKARIRRVLSGYKIEDPSSLPLYWLYRKRSKLNHAGHRQEIVKFILENKIALTVIDTFSSAFDGDENDVKEVNSAMETIYSITSTNCAVLLLAHQKKSAGKNIDMDENLRGSSHIAASYDSHIGIVDREETESGYNLQARLRSRTQEEREATITLKFGTNDEGQDFVTGKAYVNDGEGKDKFKEFGAGPDISMDMVKSPKKRKDQ